jgi:uncharacterized membrane protein YpjA
VLRERGSWWEVGMIIVFGHFFVPFLTLLRIDAKLSITIMLPVCIWAWIMHYMDMQFNVMPVLHPNGFTLHILDPLCMLFIGAVLVFVFIKYLKSHAPYPLRDPRLKEAVTFHEIAPASPISISPEP